MKSYVGGKYIPLKLVLFPSLAMFSVFIFLIMPVSLYLKGVPFHNWSPVFIMSLLIGFAMIGFFSIMTWVFCELCASSFSRIKATLYFGLISPVVFILTLSLVAAIKGFNFLSSVNAPQGMENILILIGSSFVFSVAIFWQSTKNT